MNLAICAEADGNRDAKSAIVTVRAGPFSGQQVTCSRCPGYLDEAGQSKVLGTADTGCVHVDRARPCCDASF